MALPNVFSKTVADQLVQRIQQLRPDTQAQWGKMSVGQMMAHCSVTYEMLYTDKHPAPNGFIKFMLKLLVKNSIVNEKPYKKNRGTAPQFLITTPKDFDVEQNRLIGFINQTQGLGQVHFEGLESNSFGVLTATEWNNLFYKHLNHHLTQFGV